MALGGGSPAIMVYVRRRTARLPPISPQSCRDDYPALALKAWRCLLRALPRRRYMGSGPRAACRGRGFSVTCSHPSHFTGRVVDTNGVTHEYGQCQRCGHIAVTKTDHDSGNVTDTAPVVHLRCRDCSRFEPTPVRDGWGWCPYLTCRVCGGAWRCEGGYRA